MYSTYSAYTHTILLKHDWSLTFTHTSLGTWMKTRLWILVPIFYKGMIISIKNLVYKKYIFNKTNPSVFCFILSSIGKEKCGRLDFFRSSLMFSSLTRSYAMHVRSTSEWANSQCWIPLHLYARWYTLLSLSLSVLLNSFSLVMRTSPVLWTENWIYICVSIVYARRMPNIPLTSQMWILLE